MKNKHNSKEATIALIICAIILTTTIITTKAYDQETQNETLHNLSVEAPTTITQNVTAITNFNTTLTNLLTERNTPIVKQNNKPYLIMFTILFAILLGLGVYLILLNYKKTKLTEGENK